MGYGAPPPPYPMRQQGTGMATAGLVLGILSVPGAIIAGCGLVFGVLGLVFSIIGMRSYPRPGTAVAGLVLSIIGLVLAGSNSIFGIMLATHAIR